jgi:hypothetical protein
MRFGVFMPKMRPNGREFESQIIHQKRKIDAKCSKINCNYHKKIKYDLRRRINVKLILGRGFYAIVL